MPKISNSSLNQEDIRQQILADRVKLLNNNLLTSIPAALVCATVIVISVYGYVSNLLLFTWFFTLIAIFIIRLLFFHLYRRFTTQTHLHLKLFILGACLSAVLWGVAGTALMPEGQYIYQASVIVIIAGVTSGSIVTLQPSLIASLSYVLLSVLPLDIWLFLQRTTSYDLLGIAVTGFIFFMIVTAKRGYDLLITTLSFQHQNEAINCELKKANQLLKQEVIKHQESEASLAELAAIVEFSHDAIIGFDNKGYINSWNKGAEVLYGYTAKEMLGELIHRLSPLSQHDLMDSILEQMLNNVSIQHVELERRHKLGRFIPVSVTLSPIRKSNGQIIGFSSMDRDISERKQIDRLKNEFISVVSHELRTPLTSIKGSLGLIIAKDKENLTPQTQQLLEISNKNCERLIRLINDILDVEKMESGKLDFKFNKINLRNVILHAIDETKAFAEKYQVSIKFADCDAWVIGDYDRLIQVMINLMSNAIKFTPPKGSIMIDMEYKNDYVTICVTDKGAGIPKDFQEKIFNKFAQADSASTREKGGTGLGLNICQAILEKHNSQVYFSTQEGKGTTFYFSLPLA